MKRIITLMTLVVFPMFCQNLTTQSMFVAVEKKSIPYNGLYNKMQKYFENCKLSKITYTDVEALPDKKNGFYVIMNIGVQDKTIKDKFKSIENKIFVFFDKSQTPETQSIAVDTITSSTKVTKDESWLNIKTMIESVMNKSKIACLKP